MPVTSIEKRARLVERHVMLKIAPLQKSLLDNRGGASRARAALARLRRLTSSGDVAWTLVGSDVFEGWPEELECPHGAAADVAQDRALMAVCGALGLYALHQQSESQPMAIMQDPEQGPRRITSASLSVARADRSRLISTMPTGFVGAWSRSSHSADRESGATWMGFSTTCGAS